MHARHSHTSGTDLNGLSFPPLSWSPLLRMTASPPRLSLLLLAVLLPLLRQGASADDGAEFFETRIRPILSEQCYECHGAKKRKGGLRLDARKWILEGGDTGPAFAAGDPGKSLI